MFANNPFFKTRRLIIEKTAGGKLLSYREILCNEFGLFELLSIVSEMELSIFHKLLFLFLLSTKEEGKLTVGGIEYRFCYTYL